MIYLCSPYYNEDTILNIRCFEDAKWGNELHITEANRTFQNDIRDYTYNNDQFEEGKFVKYHRYDAKGTYIKNNMVGKLTLLPYRFSGSEYKRSTLAYPTWYNESKMRQKSVSYITPEDTDIIIVSDIDEILDPKCIDKMIELVKKNSIITCKLRFTLFYFNLFSKNWGGAPDYSYRLFMMTGHKFKKLYKKIDELRKEGERGNLQNEIYCTEEFCGFHHSWLGDEEKISQKLMAYAHTEHKILNDADYIKNCLKYNKSIFPNHELFKDDDICLLDSIEHMRRIDTKYFI